MPRVVKRIAATLFALFVASALAFGGSTLLASSGGEFCGDDPGEIGTCPPYDDSSCFDDCLLIYGNPGGKCHLPTDCCICPV